MISITKRANKIGIYIYKLNEELKYFIYYTKSYIKENELEMLVDWRMI